MSGKDSNSKANLISTIESWRKWVTTLCVMVFVPLWAIVKKNERLEMEQFVSSHYVSTTVNADQWREHKDWAMEQRSVLQKAIVDGDSQLRQDTLSVTSRLEKSLSGLETKVDAMNVKLDACIMNQNLMQVQLKLIDQSSPRKN